MVGTLHLKNIACIMHGKREPREVGMPSQGLLLSKMPTLLQGLLVGKMSTPMQGLLVSKMPNTAICLKQSKH